MAASPTRRSSSALRLGRSFPGSQVRKLPYQLICDRPLSGLAAVWLSRFLTACEITEALFDALNEAVSTQLPPRPLILGGRPLRRGFKTALIRHCYYCQRSALSTPAQLRIARHRTPVTYAMQLRSALHDSRRVRPDNLEEIRDET